MIRDHVPGVEEVLDRLVISPEQKLLLALIVEVVRSRNLFKIFPTFVRPDEEDDLLVRGD